jgi:hypothetical protein
VRVNSGEVVQRETEAVDAWCRSEPLIPFLDHGVHLLTMSSARTAIGKSVARSIRSKRLCAIE